MDENIFNERLEKIVYYCEHIDREVTIPEIARAVNMAPDVVQATIGIYCERKQKELNKNPLLAMSGPDEKMEILIYKIKEMSKARFYIEGQKKLMKLTGATRGLKDKVLGVFDKKEV